jgi:hypothetical protein
VASVSLILFPSIHLTIALSLIFINHPWFLTVAVVAGLTPLDQPITTLKTNVFKQE